MSVNTPDSRRGLYYFGIHGQSHYESRQRRRRLRQQPQPRQAVDARAPTLHAVVDHENLLDVFYKIKANGGRAPGIDSITYDDFGATEIAEVLRGLSRACCEGRYLPREPSIVEIPRIGRAPRELRLGVIVDRVISRAVLNAVQPLIDPLFLAGNFGFRPNKSIWQMLAVANRYAAEHECYALATDDVADAFPSIPLTESLAGFAEYVFDRGLLHLIEIVLRGHLGLAHDVGLSQGDALSPLAMNLAFHRILDQPFAADPYRSFWLRYADNLGYLCRNVSEARQALQRARELLSAAGLSLKGEDGDPVDLRIPETSRQILGFRVSHDRNRLCFGIGERTWERLGQALDEAHEAPNPLRTAKYAVKGWLEQLGPVFGSVEERAVIEPVRQIAAAKGFRELFGERELHGICEQASSQWRRVCRGVHA